MPNDKKAHNDTSTPDASARPTMHRPLRWLWLAVAVIVLDLATKYVASSQLGYAQPVEVLPFFNLTLLHNTGAAFSFLATRIKNDEKLLAIALPLIIGGALGNLYDRLVHGYVVDFLSFHVAGWYYPAFNVADIAITLGAVALIWESIMGERRRKKAANTSH